MEGQWLVTQNYLQILKMAKTINVLTLIFIIAFPLISEAR
jgi:hypothetical protein